MTSISTLKHPLPQFDPFRTKSWRWDRVLEIVEREPRAGRCKRSDDAAVRVAREFQLKFRRGQQTGNLAEVYREFPDLFGAYQIYESSHTDRKDLIEARILAQQPFKEIAMHTGATEGALVWYEKLYFNVLDRLRATDWIIHEALLPNAYTSADLWEGHEHSLSIKFFAWVGGAKLLEFMLVMVNRSDTPQTHDQCLEFVDAAWADIFKARSIKAARHFGINRYNVMDVFAVHTRIMELQRATDGGQQSRNLLEQGLADLLQGLPFAAGAAGVDAAQGTPLGDLDKLPAELRHGELYFVPLNEQLPGLDPYLDYTIPEVAEESPEPGKVNPNADAA